MRKVMAAISALFLLTMACSTAHNTLRNQDEVYRNNIVGSWAEGGSPYTIATFLKGGKYEGQIFKTGSSPLKNRLIAIAEGTWWIENGKLYNTVTKLEPPIFPIQKEPYVDVIVSISNDVMTLINDEGKQYTKLRVE